MISFDGFDKSDSNMEADSRMKLNWLTEWQDWEREKGGSISANSKQQSGGLYITFSTVAVALFNDFYGWYLNNIMQLY